MYNNEVRSMIPFIRSLKELMVITQPENEIGSQVKQVKYRNDYKKKEESKNHSYYKAKKIVNLPTLPKVTRRKWIKGKIAVSKFFDELDYNNQIQPSYELTLLDRQKNYDNNEAA